jgi:hypothetical protein
LRTSVARAPPRPLKATNPPKLFEENANLFEANANLFEEFVNLFEANANRFEEVGNLFEEKDKLFEENGNLFEGKANRFEENANLFDGIGAFLDVSRDISIENPESVTGTPDSPARSSEPKKFYIVLFR